MNLYKIYHDICNRGKERGVKRKKGFELHHILPKSMNGTNDPSNLCLLTPKEHYVVHHCLAKTGNNKMIFAFWRMVNSKGQNNHRISSKEYEQLKQFASEQMSIKMKCRIPWCKGKTGIYSEEYINNLRIRMTGQNSHRFGKKLTEEHKLILKNANLGKKVSEETKLKMSLTQKGRKRSNEFKQKIRESLLGKPGRGKGYKHTDEWKLEASIRNAYNLHCKRIEQDEFIFPEVIYACY